MKMTEAANHHAAIQTPEEVTHDLLGRLRATGGVWLAFILLVLLAAAGAVRLSIMAASGPQPLTNWGYAAATLAFLVSTAQAAPILSFASRLAKGYWAIPIRRASDLLGISGIVTTPLFIVLLLALPDWRGRVSIWNANETWPGAPFVWDTIAILLLTVAGLAIIYVGSLPDLAAARDVHGSRLAGILALGWHGRGRQWAVLSTGIILLGGFYLMWFPYVHLFVVSDLGMALVPGWKSSLMPPYHAVAGLQAGLSTALVISLVLRRVAGLERYIGIDPFWGASKILLGLTLLFFYFTWAEFLPIWYGRTPEEIGLIGTLMLGPFLPLMVGSFVLNFIAPFVLLIWNPIRKSAMGPALVGLIIVIGNFVDRVRIYVASWSVAGPVGQEITTYPPIRPPQVGDIAIIVGALAALGLLYIAALRVLPPISLWEYKTTLLLRAERRFGRTEVGVVAKPR